MYLPYNHEYVFTFIEAVGLDHMAARRNNHEENMHPIRLLELYIGFEVNCNLSNTVSKQQTFGDV